VTDRRYGYEALLDNVAWRRLMFVLLPPHVMNPQPGLAADDRYGYEALLDNELHGAEDFYFTPYAQRVREQSKGHRGAWVWRLP